MPHRLRSAIIDLKPTRCSLAQMPSLVTDISTC